MLKKIYTIRDSKGEIYHTPFFQNTHGEAERSFRTAVNDPQTSIYKYPEDYSLWYMGEYDDNTGLFKTKPPEHMIQAIACVKKTTIASLDDVSKDC